MLAVAAVLKLSLVFKQAELFVELVGGNV